MLVLVSFGLVLVATVLLVLGLLVDSGLGLIYASIGCSIVAGILLVVATRVKPKAATVESESFPAASTEPMAEVTATFAPPSPTPAPVPATAGDGEDFFPIADYDELTVAQIVPLLNELYPDEIEEVEARERQGRRRAAILNRLGELREQLKDAPADATASSLAPAKKTVAKKTVAKKMAAKKAGVRKSRRAT